MLLAHSDQLKTIPAHLEFFWTSPLPTFGVAKKYIHFQPFYYIWELEWPCVHTLFATLIWSILSINWIICNHLQAFHQDEWSPDSSVMLLVMELPPAELHCLLSLNSLRFLAQWSEVSSESLWAQSPGGFRCSLTSSEATNDKINSVYFLKLELLKIWKYRFLK